ncbi:MAG: hypothetical protein WC045_00730 [Patescibacteria group bacterium]
MILRTIAQAVMFIAVSTVVSLGLIQESFKALTEMEQKSRNIAHNSVLSAQAWRKTALEWKRNSQEWKKSSSDWKNLYLVEKKIANEYADGMDKYNSALHNCKALIHKKRPDLVCINYKQGR